MGFYTAEQGGENGLDITFRASEELSFSRQTGGKWQFYSNFTPGRSDWFTNNSGMIIRETLRTRGLTFSDEVWQQVTTDVTTMSEEFIARREAVAAIRR